MAYYAYTRYSSSQQNESSTTRQIELAQEWCTQNNAALSHTFSDEAVSGSRTEFDERPQLQLLLSTVKSGDVILVEQVDRLSRRHYKETLTLIWKLDALGVTLISTSQNRTITDNDISETIMSLIDADKAHQYSKQLSERSSRGKLLARKRQVEGVDGQPLSYMTPSWIRRSDDKLSYHLIPERVEVVRYMVELASFLGASAIAKRLTDEGIPCWIKSKYVNKDGETRWTASHVKTIVRNKHLSGDGDVKGIGIVQNYFPAAITKDEHIILNQHLSKRTNSKSRTNGGTTFRNLFSNLGRCGVVENGVMCGHTMWIKNCGARKNGSQRIYLYCANGCSRQMKYDGIEKSFIKFCREIDWSIFDGDSTKDETKTIELKIAEIEESKKTTQGQIDNLVLAIASTGNTALIAKLEELQGDLSAYDENLNHHKNLLRAELYKRSKTNQHDIKQLAENLSSDAESRMKLNQALRDRLDYLRFNLNNSPRPHISLRSGGRAQVIFFDDNVEAGIGYEEEEEELG
ncbi:recombinase family protein [Enterovibrio nigricans]|uniref:Site-specific DNA recombinase n=1 Tax=Enterovibrio nigricans DSM 22720 TaxID=1121868 RepID=A0A1T4VJD6_9GAMM|nr:recombinase family protein [Enterovibrio nigricans]PKF49726.1 recombinase family protein [Enterovibrio nigricans]SKA64978.1 Site-specific DNA recombinase [Enterovibrio nigricans DSM 22720]